MAALESDHDYESIINECILELKKARKEDSFNLKPQQKEAVVALLQGVDVMAILPTGFGKSLIFQLFVLARSKLNHLKGVSNGIPAVLVICPLVSLVKDQVREASSLGIECTALSCDKNCGITGREQIIFASAEQALNREFKRLLRDGELNQRICSIIVDETHTVETWSDNRKSSKKKKKAKGFREDYEELSILRSLCKEGVPVLALTGTADKSTVDFVIKSLSLGRNCLKIFISPNREDLRINVIETKKQFAYSKLRWISELANENGHKMPKTIIFCNTITDVATVVNRLLFDLGNDAYSPRSSKKPSDCLVGIFHSNSWERCKENVMKELKNDGKKRIIVATSALSMGVNFPDIRYVVNWGPARNLLDHHQEAGRAGRDNVQSDVVVIFHGQQLSHCEDDVKYFVRASGCLRVASYKAFDESIKPLEQGHDCCSNCRKSCLCQGDICAAPQLPFEKGYSQSYDSLPRYTRPVSEEDKTDLSNALKELQLSERGRGLLFGKAACHGFSDELIQDIVNNSCTIFTLEDVMNSPVYSMKHALQILEIFDELFGDIPSTDDIMNLLGNLPSQLEEINYEHMYQNLPESADEESESSN